MSGRSYYYRRKKKSKIYLYIFTIIILLLSLFPIVKGLTRQKGKEGETTMYLSMSGFSPRNIVAKVNEPINIYLVNLDNQYHEDGGGKHQFASDELGFNYIIQPLDSKSVSIVIDKPGEYMFYCDICCGGKESASMQGTITVL